MFSNGDPTRLWEAVTPADGADLLGGESGFLYVGGTGNITCDVVNSVTGVKGSQLFSNLAVGYHPIRTTRIYATGTTATLMKSARAQ